MLGGWNSPYSALFLSNTHTHGHLTSKISEYTISSFHLHYHIQRWGCFNPDKKMWTVLSSLTSGALNIWPKPLVSQHSSSELKTFLLPPIHLSTYYITFLPTRHLDPPFWHAATCELLKWYVRVYPHHLHLFSWWYPGTCRSVRGVPRQRCKPRKSKLIKGILRWRPPFKLNNHIQLFQV